MDANSNEAGNDNQRTMAVINNDDSNMIQIHLQNHK